MKKYKIADFQVGDSVYHLSNYKIIMVVIEINTTKNEISCRWVDKNGVKQVVEFMPEELGKASDLSQQLFF